jgi:hypothetical protein
MFSQIFPKLGILADFPYKLRLAEGLLLMSHKIRVRAAYRHVVSRYWRDSGSKDLFHRGGVNAVYVHYCSC